jgi:tRNA A37 threonylcarbamoyladenosine modification protein TsaB
MSRLLDRCRLPTLVLEGARRDAQWAVVHAGKIVGGRIKDRGAAERLAPTVAAGLSEAGLRAGDLRYVIVGVGPGSYAGLRIVLAFAKGLVQATPGAGLVAVPSMDAMLQDVVEARARGEAIPEAARPVAIMNAFSGQVFAHGDGVPTDSYLPQALNERLGPGVLGVLDGDLPMQKDLAVETWLDLRAMPGGDVPYGVLSLGLDRIERGELAEVTTLLPDYGRLSSAELKANLG